MNITLENIDSLNAVLKIEVKADDYKNDVEKLLKDYQKKVNIPGFRAGKVPKGVVKKRFGTSAKVEKVNELVSQNIGNYLTENNVEYLGGPLPINNEIDWENAEDFSFEYELGLLPEVEVKINKRNKLTYFNIQADEKQLEEYATNIANRYGSLQNPDAAQAGDMVFGEFTQVDAEGNHVEGGISNKTTVAVDAIADEKVKAEFIDSGANTRIVLDPKSAFATTNEAITALGIDETTLENLEGQFAFTIETVNRMIPAEFNDELFAKLYPDGEVKTEEEFKAKLKEEAEGMYQNDSDRKFYNDAVEYILGKEEFDLPEAFLKKWIKANQENEISDEQIDADFENYKKMLRWQVIESKLGKENEIKVEVADIEAEARQLVSLQMAQYGQTEVADDMLDGIVKNVLQNEEERQNIAKNVFDKKMTTLFKEKFKIEDKEVSVEDFITMMKPAEEK